MTFSGTSALMITSDEFGASFVDSSLESHVVCNITLSAILNFVREESGPRFVFAVQQKINPY